MQVCPKADHFHSPYSKMCLNNSCINNALCCCECEEEHQGHQLMGLPKFAKTEFMMLFGNHHLHDELPLLSETLIAIQDEYWRMYEVISGELKSIIMGFLHHSKWLQDSFFQPPELDIREKVQLYFSRSSYMKQNQFRSPEQVKAYCSRLKKQYKSKIKSILEDITDKVNELSTHTFPFKKNQIDIFADEVRLIMEDNISSNRSETSTNLQKENHQQPSGIEDSFQSSIVEEALDGVAELREHKMAWLEQKKGGRSTMASISQSESCLSFSNYLKSHKISVQSLYAACLKKTHYPTAPTLILTNKPFSPSFTMVSFLLQSLEGSKRIGFGLIDEKRAKYNRFEDDYGISDHSYMFYHDEHGLKYRSRGQIRDTGIILQKCSVVMLRCSFEKRVGLEVMVEGQPQFNTQLFTEISEPLYPTIVLSHPGQQAKIL